MRGWLPAQLPGPPTFIYHGRGLRTIPIMKPNFKHRRGTKAVFGPTAIYEGGKDIYSLLGDRRRRDVSVPGCASSFDGETTEVTHHMKVFNLI